MVIIVHEENLVEFDLFCPIFKPLIFEYEVIFLADLLQIVNTFQLLLKKRANYQFQCKLQFSFSCPQRNLILKLSFVCKSDQSIQKITDLVLVKFSQIVLLEFSKIMLSNYIIIELLLIILSIIFYFSTVLIRL